MNQSTESCRQSVQNQLSNWEAVLGRIIKLLPDFISSVYDADSLIPIAAVCLHDCAHTLGAVRYALDRYCEVGAERRASGEEMSAVYFERYYLDDTALRLYSAAEHLAAAVCRSLELDLDQRGRGRLYEKVRNYLRTHDPDSPLSRAFNALHASTAWEFTMKYRGRWVHKQPPIIAGFGVSYGRRKRWEASSDSRTRTLRVGPGDRPEYTVDELAYNFIAAFADFLLLLQVVLDSYYATLARVGIIEEVAGLSVPVGRHGAGEAAVACS